MALLKKTILAQAVASIGLLTVTNVAMAGLYQDADKQTQISADSSKNIFVNGDVYVDNHTYFSQGSKLEVTGSVFQVNTPSGNPKLDIQATNIARVEKNIDLAVLSVAGQLQLGGNLTVHNLTINGTVTDLNGKSFIQQATIKTSTIENLGTGFWNTGADLTFGKLTVESGTLQTTGGSLTIQSGQLGSVGHGINLLVYEGGNVSLNGDAYVNGLVTDSDKSVVDVNGTLTLGGNNYSKGNGGSVEADNLVVDGWTEINNLKVDIKQDIVQKGGLFVITAPTTLTVGNSLTLQKDASLQYRSTDKPLHIKTLILEKDSVQQDGLQTYGGALEIGTMYVNKAGRIDVYSKPTPDKNTQISIDKAVIADGASFAFSNSRETNDDAKSFANVAITTLEMGKGATIENGVWKEANKPDKFRGGSNVVVTNLTGDGATITNHNSFLTIGADKNSQVVFNGTIDDKVDGVDLTLNSSSIWTVAGASHIAQLSLMGGIADISKTEDNLSLTNLSGKSGTVVMDAAKTNTVKVTKTDEKTQVEVKASENADKVTTDQATTMVQRLEGVTNKTGRVDEGMYQGAITVDKTGHATQAKNDLMADTLELASASTLSLNRILMNDVRKRLGDIRSLEATNGVWARYDGGKLSGEGTTNKFNTLHIGGDIAPFADNSMRLGVSASYTKGDVDYTRGSSELDAYSLAAYGTWMADNGLFADLIARVAKAKSDMKVDGVYKGDLNNTAYSLSGEMGWRFDFNDMFYAEPQMEATYTYIDSDKMTLSGNGEAYHYAVDSFDSLIGRVGVLAGMKCPAQKGDLYVRASMVHEFLGDAMINGGNMAKIENDGKDTWVEYGVGANFNIMKNAYIWADIERTAGANVDEDWRGTVGVRYAF